MTQAEKMIEEWWEWWIIAYKENLLDYTSEAEMKEYFKNKLHQVVEQTLEEVCEEIDLAIVTESRIIPSNMEGIAKRLKYIIRLCRWWEKEVE